MSSARWFSAAMILNQRDLTKVLVLRYWRDRRTQPNLVDIKFPGGKEKTGNGRQDQTPEDTLLAEIYEEVLSGCVDGNIPGIQYVELEEARVELPGHTKHFFIVLLDTGSLRQDEMSEEEDDGREEVLSPPFFERVDVLAGEIFRGHAGALKVLCENLLRKNQDPALERTLRVLEGRGF